ncbi:cytidine deaminase [Idiomarina seosinensis]|uniref:Cytidine deaminase n=1 Tax=Idiomarina seosinensis TaxID=281739 RepID=A0A432ZJH9_9GAMM|nr:cytidine deaminase [Idiomarina seosinensis]RUO78089.1 cytidine deaminase [Idiomarina seosinensis]
MQKSPPNLEPIGNAAKLASEKAYAPYSDFKVGAAMQLHDGSIISGCNVENVSYGLSNCAERTAIFRAVAEGHDLSKVEHLALYTPTDTVHSPCGACRQVMVEFFDANTRVSSYSRGGSEHWTVAELLPNSFNFK